LTTSSPTLSAEPPAAAPRPLPRAWRLRLPDAVRRWLQLLDPARVRFWGVVLPVHIVAFTALYLGNYTLLKEGYANAGAAAARRQIEQVVREMPAMMPAAGGTGNPHLFGQWPAMDEPIGLRLYSDQAVLIWPRDVAPEDGEADRVRRLLADTGRRDDIWIEGGGSRHWVRGVVRVNTGRDCLPCHQKGHSLGAATIRIDFTREMREMQALLGRRAGLVLGFWLLVVGAVAVVVQRTVRRSLSNLETDLDDAAAGRTPSNSNPDLPLDPASAAFHGRLRDFLRRQRAREAEVVSRLVHVDQLASLGQLSAGLAHEIKNPLAGIQGALEVLKHETTDASTGHLYEEMLGELRRVNGILQRLLESGRPAPLRLARTSLARLVSDTVELARPALGRKNVDLRMNLEADLPAIRLDAAKMRQVLLNLIQNAGEAMGEAGGHITVHARALPERREVVVAVEDDGPGIAQPDLARLFEPFFTTKFAGTGLGLTISKSLVDQHGGRIEADSGSSRGATFLVFLPEAGPKPARPPDGSA
jgi:signal transduction histidine kinase